MLKLARREDESLVVITPAGEQIKILVMDAFDGFARLGIEVPSEYEILKEEFLTSDNVS
jgi:carbon storage regulator